MITVLQSVAQDQYGVTHAEREREDVCAMGMLGVTLYEQWPEPDVDPDWVAVEAMMQELPEPDLVIAPAVESTGHIQHNTVGELADHVFGVERVIHYLTYTAGAVRSTHGTEVEFEPHWLFRKHAALSCYQSQALTPSYRHFVEDLREFVR